jgi:uracil-DNA glycosylase
MSVAQAPLFETPQSTIVGDNRLLEPLSASFARVPASWRAVTDAFLQSGEGRALVSFVDGRVREGAAIYPRQVFRSLEFAAPRDVRVVILGQDPYHGAGQAQGLAFSVAPGQRKIPPSLRNILKEVRSDIGKASVCVDDLSPWAEQGVLLLNTALTVEDGAPQSHADRGWEVLTDSLLACVSAQRRSAVYMLWGASAQRKRALCERVGDVGHEHRVKEPAAGKNLILTANHPSPLSATRGSAPFIGCRHFSKANAFLAEAQPGSPSIDW